MSGERHDNESSDEDSVKAKFAFSEGTGTPLSELPAVQAVATRGAAFKQLETRLESLHRLVFGRAGKTGERRRALEPFCGFPEQMREDVLQKVQKLKKDKLRDLIQALGMPVHISKTQSEVAKGVTAFLMRPEGGKAAKTAKKTSGQQKKAAKRERATPARGGGDETAATSKEEVTGEGEKGKETTKRAKKDVPVAESTSVALSKSDDAIRVAVYKRVFSTPRTERGQITTKTLRLELEKSFGDLGDRKTIIKDAASECISALVAAEEAIFASCASASDSAAKAVSTTVSVIRNGSGEPMVEPSPAPQPPQMMEPEGGGTSRSRAPPPVTPDGSVTAHTSVPTFPAHPPVTASVVSVPPQIPPGAPVL